MSANAESVMAARVVEYLTANEWDVYQEVQVRTHGRIADIVARKSGIVWAIECKRVFGFEVVEQAHGWRDYAHYTSVAVPRHPSWFAMHVALREGVGVVVAHDYTATKVGRQGVRCGKGDVHELSPAPIQRNCVRLFLPDMLAALTPERKTHALAGTNRGGYFTPYARTCWAIRELLRKHPEGLTPKEVAAGIDDYHYATVASARSTIAQRALAGQMPGVIAKREPNIRLYLTSGWVEPEHGRSTFRVEGAA